MLFVVICSPIVPVVSSLLWLNPNVTMSTLKQVPHLLLKTSSGFMNGIHSCWFTINIHCNNYSRYNDNRYIIDIFIKFWLGKIHSYCCFTINVCSALCTCTMSTGLLPCIKNNITYFTNISQWLEGKDR